MLAAVLCSLTIEMQVEWLQMRGIGSPRLFLIASHTLIGTIYHSLKPRDSLWKFTRLWVTLFITSHCTTSTVQIKPSINHNTHPDTHAHTHTPDLTAITHSEDRLLHSNRFPSDESKRTLQERTDFHESAPSLLQRSMLLQSSNLSQTAANSSVTIKTFITNIKSVQDP